MSRPKSYAEAMAVYTQDRIKIKHAVQSLLDPISAEERLEILEKVSPNERAVVESRAALFAAIDAHKNGDIRATASLIREYDDEQVRIRNEAALRAMFPPAAKKEDHTSEEHAAILEGLRPA